MKTRKLWTLEVSDSGYGTRPPLRSRANTRCGQLIDPRGAPCELVFSVEVLFGVFEARGKATPPSMVYCGDTQAGKDIAAALIRDVGFDPIDAGPLRNARYTEPLAVLIAHLAYGGTEGPELAYRFERFGQKG